MIFFWSYLIYRSFVVIYPFLKNKQFDRFCYDVDLYIAIPIHNEIKFIRFQYEFWYQIVESRCDINVKFIFPNNSSVSKLIDSFKSVFEEKPSNKITYIIDESPISSKSTKINKFVESIPTTSSMGVVDCDTVFEACSIPNIIDLLRIAPVVQIVPISSFKNCSALVKLFYTPMRIYRNIAIEYIQRSASYKSKWYDSLTGIKYLCGASLFMHTRIFRLFGPLPIWNDDIFFGYLMNLKNIPIAVGETFSEAPFPTKINSIFKQRARIKFASNSRIKALNKTGFSKEGLSKIATGLLNDHNKEISLLFLLFLSIKPNDIFILVSLFAYFTIEYIEFRSIRSIIKKSNLRTRYFFIDHILILPLVSVIEQVLNFIYFFILKEISFFEVTEK